MIDRTKKDFLNLYQVGVPSKHTQNNDEKHLDSNSSTKRNINGRIRACCIQDSASPGYKHNHFKQKQGVSEKNDILIINWPKRLAQLGHNNRGKNPELRPKHGVFDSNNGKKIMEYLHA